MANNSSISSVNQQFRNPDVTPSTPSNVLITRSVAPLDPSSPYYLHYSDNLGSILISSPLNGDNYPTWRHAMRMALYAKHKMGFVDGSLPKPSSLVSDFQAWEICNFMVLS